MRLLRIGPTRELSLTSDMAVPPPRYAILSHTWGPANDEVLFEDFRTKTPSHKTGYTKVWHCAKQALADGLEYCWVDTCCIDKSSSAELSEAINSMYQWYQKAVICYVYLSDVESTNQLENSAWFTRGWTLQELIAPTRMTFFNRHWKPIGTKMGLQSRLSQVTGVPTRILRGSDPRDCSVAQRMSWAARRQTTRPEDIAYCLLGLFDINMSMHYGEGVKAFKRLQRKIMRVSEDQSILAWSRADKQCRDLLARSPADFEACANVVSTNTTSTPEPYSMTNVGLSISLSMIPWAMHTYFALLECQDQTTQKELMPQWREHAENKRMGMFLKQTQRDGQFIRVPISGQQVHSGEPGKISSGQKRQRVLIVQQPKTMSARQEYFMYGFLFRNMLGTVVNNSSCEQMQSSIVSRREPEQRVWSDGLRGNFRERTAGARDGNVLLTTLTKGEHGLVAICEVTTTNASRESVLMEFGFDYVFNPVCRLRKYLTVADHANARENRRSIFQGETSLDQWMQDVEQQDVHAASASEVSPLEAVDHFKFLSDSQSDGMYCTLRGDKRHGLHARFPELNFQINIVQGLGRRAWVVDINSLVLEGVWMPKPERDHVQQRQEAMHQLSEAARVSKRKFETI